MSGPEPSDEQRFAGALMARAEADRRQLLQEAKQEAQQLVQAAEDQMARLRAERLDAARRRAREQIDVRLSEIRQEQRGREAQLVDEACRRVVDAAREELGRMRGRPNYVTLLGRMLDQALAEAPGAEGEVAFCVDERDYESAAAIQRRGPRAIDMVVGGPFLGGLQLAARDGRWMIDHTFDARLRARLPSIHVQLARLFQRPD